jgi:hypothetical protein
MVSRARTQRIKLALDHCLTFAMNFAEFNAKKAVEGLLLRFKISDTFRGIVVHVPVLFECLDAMVKTHKASGDKSISCKSSHFAMSNMSRL